MGKQYIREWKVKWFNIILSIIVILVVVYTAHEWVVHYDFSAMYLYGFAAGYGTIALFLYIEDGYWEYEKKYIRVEEED